MIVAPSSASSVRLRGWIVTFGMEVASQSILAGPRLRPCSRRGRPLRLQTALPLRVYWVSASPGRAGRTTTQEAKATHERPTYRRQRRDDDHHHAGDGRGPPAGADVLHTRYGRALRGALPQAPPEAPGRRRDLGGLPRGHKAHRPDAHRHAGHG